MKLTALEVTETGCELQRGHFLASRPQAGHSHSPKPSALLLSGLGQLPADTAQTAMGVHELRWVKHHRY